MIYSKNTWCNWPIKIYDHSTWSFLWMSPPSLLLSDNFTRVSMSKLVPRCWIWYSMELSTQDPIKFPCGEIDVEVDGSQWGLCELDCRRGFTSQAIYNLYNATCPFKTKWIFLLLLPDMSGVMAIKFSGHLSLPALLSLQLLVDCYVC